MLTFTLWTPWTVATAFSTQPVPGAPTHYWTVDGVPQSGAGRNRTFTFSTPGTHTVSAAATDVAGNVGEASATFTVTVTYASLQAQAKTLNGITAPTGYFDPLSLAANTSPEQVRRAPGCIASCIHCLFLVQLLVCLAKASIS